MKSLANTIYSCFKDKGEFSLKDAYSENSDKPKETVRARIYDNRLDLSMLGDASIDCILKQIYSLNVNGMVTVVLPDFTLLNFQRHTACAISWSKVLLPVVVECMNKWVTSPPGAIVNLKVTLP